MTQQTLIGPGFGAASTALEVVSGIDLSRKLAITPAEEDNYVFSHVMTVDDRFHVCAS
jgi:hypothetical protein